VKYANRARELELSNVALPTYPRSPSRPDPYQRMPSPREPDKKCYEWSAKGSCMRGDNCRFRHGDNDRRAGFGKSPSKERANAGAGTTPRGGLSWGKTK
jgi:hypothetical protein